jgi:phage terminase large subunit GpA-like protein
MNRKTIRLFNRIAKNISPPPALTVSEWADLYRKLSSETSAEPGQWHTERAPYQREMMDAVNDPEIEEVVFKTSSQVGKSEIVNNIAGYFIDNDPCPMLMIQPTIEMAEDYSKRRLAPMFKDTEVLTKKVADSKTRDTNNTILMKQFPGGSLALAGANSPAGLASRNIRIILADEIDRFPPSAGTEGDPLLLVEKRTITFWNKKKIYISTPTIKGASRIDTEYEKGTQERWRLECPHCGHFAFINLHGIKFEHKKDEKGNYSVWDITFQCPACLEKFDEYTWKAQPGKWIADNPEARSIRSFHLNAFVSPWVHWESIILEWLQVKHDPEKHKVFKNTMLGESWEENISDDEYDYLLQRREEYPADLPDGVLLLTCGVDVQDDRLEFEIVGWGRGEQSWGIKYGVLMGKPDQEKVWNDLRDILGATYYFESEIGLKIACTFIDSGGHHTSDVYKFCRKNEYRKVFAIRGMPKPGLPIIYSRGRSKKENCLYFNLGVDGGKARILSRIQIKQPGDGYCHFPLDEKRGYDQVYFKGLLSEHQVTEKSGGKLKLVWRKRTTDIRNEPLDVRNYAQAAFYLLPESWLEVFEQQLAEGQKSQNTPIPVPKQPQKRRGVIKKGVDF